MDSQCRHVGRGRNRLIDVYNRLSHSIGLERKLMDWKWSTFFLSITAYIRKCVVDLDLGYAE